MTSYKEFRKINDEIDLYIREDNKKGVWQCQYTINDKRVRKTTKKTDFLEAQKAALDFYTSDLEKTEFHEEKKNTINYVVSEYLKTFRNIKKSENTKEKYKRDFEKYIIPYFNNKDVNRIRNYDLESFVENLKANNLAESSINQILTTVRQLFKFASRKEFLERERMPYIENLKLKKNRRRDSFTLEEIKTIRQNMHLNFDLEIDAAATRLLKTKHKDKVIYGIM